ncbi:CDP-diacylglycerol-glycerol-3-phosphate 3-phosphatidyltransferase [Wickerhamomyces ciferrii]|uniref:CDP-diacylglycerol--glycerol-3-phosphate 3-phosphatidyltransferase n=1 Tax=Wickerhamomyces ciferrii (strain ATCC 14091 / BCRC 22168 / CBS 111 / JCM 3599 / NBRC 0793 / NRRL Y-1031 F-60-10) TaxID=1206466 RepID=K0KNW6_WICCF|nr:CDP-diacylglycerol-glycerol-3-phosphate 3-phosphatidyltransferase [Wickerhamomyces ciferrii]CCH42788.1 CDP-diacylglycerol-glycerol-3-phosphate 3-phosphatidyltransferase [Wickerhamomyces ciferrii]
MSSLSGFHQTLLPLVKEMDQVAPRFELNSDQIDIIHEPSNFYDHLKQKISKAQNRIFFSSLYIGRTQDELIGCISEALKSNPNLKVHILTDALRGTREAPSKSSASLLGQLMKEHSEQVDIRMYHTPNLNGINKSIVPNRFNEGFGLQHMKIYGFDDEVMLSGANLSSDYFTDRQDRYYLFKSKGLSDYYFDIQKTISSFSYKLLYSNNNSKFKLEWPDSNPLIEPIKNPKEFKIQSSKILRELLRGDKFRSKIIQTEDSTSPKTFVYPISQFTPLMITDESTEKPSILKLLNYLKEPSIKWAFTAGYFNMLPEIKDKLLQLNSKGNVITASPLANGFYKSKGISGYLPEAYLYLSKNFLKEVILRSKQETIKLREWKNGEVNTKGGWSYHAKGFWATSPGETQPSMTIIGSSNYTRRAYSFDLETNALIITNASILKNKMQRELDNLMAHTKELTLKDYDEDERKISKFAKFATKLLGKRL